MKTLIAIFCSILALNAFAGEPLAFSPHAKSIQFSGAKGDYDATFTGEVKLSGVVEVEFERDLAIFYPDEISLKKLPSVIQGSHSKNAEAILIASGKKLLNQVLTKRAILKLLVSRAETFQSAAVVTIRNIGTQIVCDTREYDAELVSITLHPNVATGVIAAGYGC